MYKVVNCLSSIGTGLNYLLIEKLNDEKLNKWNSMFEDDNFLTSKKIKKN